MLPVNLCEKIKFGKPDERQSLVGMVSCLNCNIFKLQKSSFEMKKLSLFKKYYAVQFKLIFFRKQMIRKAQSCIIHLRIKDCENNSIVFQTQRSAHRVKNMVSRTGIPSQFIDGHRSPIDGHRWAFVKDDPVDENRNFLITKIRSKRPYSKFRRVLYIQPKL